MNTISVVQYISPPKNVLQQANSNVISSEARGKLCDRNIIVLRKKRKSSPENENRLEVAQSDLSRLRSVRLFPNKCSSQESVIHAIKQEDSSDDDLKKVVKRPILPNYVTNADGGMYRKQRQYKHESSQKEKGCKLPPVSIARRNARERNRVKQVNAGFSNLRDKIPEYIAGGLNEEKGRKVNKKLSKVETLRMAVDYIRHLETLLDFKAEETCESVSWNTSNSSTSYPSPVESPCTPFDQGYVLQDQKLYDYHLELHSSALSPGEPADFSVNDTEPRCFELFDKIKQENVYTDSGDTDVDINNAEDETDLSLRSEVERPEDSNSPLPSISETFPTRKMSAFYDSRHYMPYQLIDLSTKD